MISTGMMIALALLYVGIAISFFYEQKYGFAMSYVCYAIANFGLILAYKGI